MILLSLWSNQTRYNARRLAPKKHIIYVTGETTLVNNLSMSWRTLVIKMIGLVQKLSYVDVGKYAYAKYSNIKELFSNKRQQARARFLIILSSQIFSYSAYFPTLTHDNFWTSPASLMTFINWYNLYNWRSNLTIMTIT